MASEEIRRIQQALKIKGLDPGDIDGIWGRNTSAAVRQFQSQQGLKADGVVGPQTTAARQLDDGPTAATRCRRQAMNRDSEPALEGTSDERGAATLRASQHAHATGFAVALDDSQALVLDEAREGVRVVEADDAGARGGSTLRAAASTGSGT